MKIAVTILLALFFTTLQAQAQTYQVAEQEKSTLVKKTKSSGAYSQVRAVPVQRKAALVNLAAVQRNDVKKDLDTLIAFEPIASMSVEEFQEMSSISQWALGHRQRLQMISKLEARRAVLSKPKSGRRIGKFNAAELLAIEGKLNSIGEDAQLANIDLQNSLQRMQQTLQTLSNVSKSQHDTAMAVIRKIG